MKKCKKNSPAISVITACYNSEKSIELTLKSLYSQDFMDFEHIIVDGGSNDHTMEIVKKFQDQRTKIISESDAGIYDALNKGLKIATGEYIGFLHSDDFYINSTTLREIVDFLTKNQLDAIYGDLVFVDKKNKDRIVRYWVSGKYAKSKIKKGWMPPHPTLYVRTKLIRKVGEFNQEFKISADYDHILRLFLQYDPCVGYINKPIIVMATGGASTRNVAALIKKKIEDMRIIQNHKLNGFETLILKSLTKIMQIRPFHKPKIDSLSLFDIK